MGHIYERAIKKHRERSKERLEVNKRTFYNLCDKTSTYAKEIEALGELHERAHEIYKDAPDELTSDNEHC